MCSICAVQLRGTVKIVYLDVCDMNGTSYLRHGVVIAYEMVRAMTTKLLFMFYCCKIYDLKQWLTMAACNYLCYSVSHNLVQVGEAGGTGGGRGREGRGERGMYCILEEKVRLTATYHRNQL